METRRNTTAGVLFWTPAPARTSSTSSVASEDVWEDEERVEREDDFASQMDENGIIGLSEALEDVELGETSGGVDPGGCPGSFTLEQVDASGCERDTPPEELSYNLSEHLSHVESAGEDGQTLSSWDDMKASLKTWGEDEEVRPRKEEQQTERLPQRDKHLDMTVEEEEERRRRSDRNRKTHKLCSPSGKLRAPNGLVEGENPQMSSTPSTGVSSHHCPVPPSTSVGTAPIFPHLLHFTAEELADAPGIEAETFPEMDFIESLPESHCSHRSLTPSPRRPETQLRASPQPAATSSEQVMSNDCSRVSNGPGKRSGKTDKHHKHSPEATYSRTRSLNRIKAESFKSKPHNTNRDKEPRTPRAKSNAAEVEESRKTPLSYRTPDFSQVEPRVCFPKGGYKPPKSRQSTRKSLSPEPPLVFKSPADIVKEVLLNTTDGSPAPSDCNRPTTSSAANSTVPQEFRCRQQATTLLEQLQEDYNRLLTKYAEAENTIDRLRLEAKVNLYSDPPVAGHSVPSGLAHDASKFIKLDFPQAQRAEISSVSLHPNGHNTHQNSSADSPSTRSPAPQLGQQLATVLFHQTDKFLQQLQTFENLLQSRKLKPSEQIKGVSQLGEGLDSLERGFLLARDEHRLLQQRGAEINHFDPERELEGLIFQCGLRMEELKEQVEQMRKEQLTWECPPSPPPQPSSSSGTPGHPQIPPVPLLVDPGDAAKLEVSSASKESDEEESEEEETLNSIYLKPLNGKHRRVEEDSDVSVDHNQSYKNLPSHLDQSLRERALLSAAIKTDVQPEDKEEEERRRGAGNNETWKPPSQRKDKSDHQDSPDGTSKQQSSRSSPPLCRASSQPSMLPVLPPSSRRRLEVGKSHSSSLSSLGEITASERRNSKVQVGSRRVLSQDGIISPETDSGFVGSESSRVIPAAAAAAAAAPSPLHQRASQSVSVPQEGNSGRPQTGPVSAPSSSRSQRVCPDQPRRSRLGPRRRTFSCSPQRWTSLREQTGVDSGTSEFGLRSDSTHTGSEGEQSDQYTESLDSLHSSHSSSSPAARYHHGNSLRAPSSSQVSKCNDALQSLQAEVTRLRERLDSCLRNRKPLSSVRAAPSAQENCSHHKTSTPRIRSVEQQSDVSGARRETRALTEEAQLRRTARKRSASAHRQKPPHETSTRSELQSSTPPPQPQVSRCTQTSATPDSCCSHTAPVHSRTTQTGQHPVMSEAADERDSGRSRAPPYHRGRSERPVGGNREPTHSSTRCCHCPLCGRLEPSRCTEPDCRRHSDSPAHISCQPPGSPDRAARSTVFAAAAPPALLQCMAMCPAPVLLYSSPVYVSPNNNRTSSGVRGREEERGRTRRSLSVDKPSPLDSSMDRAIRAARHMKHTSGHMARSLAAGLQYHELLIQSCSY